MSRSQRWARIDVAADPPRIEVPRRYNAAVEFIDRNIHEGRGDRFALVDDNGSYTYRELYHRVNQAGQVLRQAGVQMEQRVLLCLNDGIEFAAVFWGAIKIGAVPVPVSTRLTRPNCMKVLSDSRARVLVVERSLADKFAVPADSHSSSCRVITTEDGAAGQSNLSRLIAAAPVELEVAPTTADDIAFWLYTSGSTGQPKGVLHMHRSLIHTAVLFGQCVLGIHRDDRVFSASKMFFAYGLGNTMTFPFSVGATSVVSAVWPTPETVYNVIHEHCPTIFCAVPTLYHRLLADFEEIAGELPASLRLCVSAGEPLPQETGRRWQALSGIAIVDGLGSTEMLQTFLSNRPGQVCYGSTGTAVPGYQLRLVDASGHTLGAGQIGELLVAGPSAAAGYWNRQAQTIRTFVGPWTRTGDQYVVDKDNYYHYCGRGDDMLKVGGIWVSPFEVESVLLRHPLVCECAVVGQADDGGLIKPKAFVVLKDPGQACAAVADQLKSFACEHLAAYKHPRWVEFLDELPKTATGKVRRFKLRAGASG
jgi:benzoate-CoA ligase family protein